MAGVKGRSGGARPGAGRKPQPKKTNIGVVVAKEKKRAAQVAPVEAPALSTKDDVTIGNVGTTDPLEFLESVMRNPLAEDSLRVRAAVTVAQYRHAKKADAGKKGAKADAANKASTGRFAPAAPPKPR